MSTKTDYTEEIKNLLGNFYVPVASKDDATEVTVKKTLTEIHEEVTRVLPSRWIYEDDVYQVLQEMNFNFFHDTDEDGKRILVYYMNPK
ncbi:hypothetical protein I215_01883 [Galbibacter marinus]|uniref:Uncharacterized protein n=1 Tax=Galbibacter marinus TaxID=555500 RepID=K2P5H5_9FLAO|nr:hypothetical protein [Galbibacter marinus]EKF56233.1 hypothetical protein I215_01883 [Galbibacter marinus]